MELNEYRSKEPTEQRGGHCPSSEWNKFTLPVDRAPCLFSAFVLMEAPHESPGLLLSLALLGKTVSGHQFDQDKEKPLISSFANMVIQLHKA